MSVTVSRLIIAPALVVSAVVATTVTFGDHPLKWQQVSSAVQDRVGRLIPGLSPQDHPEATEAWAAPVAVPAATGSAGAAGRSPEAYPVQRVRSEWASGSAQMGVQIYWENNPADPEATVWAKAQRVVNYVTGLAANSVTISFPFYTKGMQASSVGAKPATPSPHRLEILAHEASLAGLRVTVRPILDEKSLNPPDGWRGSIRPDSVQGWFDSYRTFLEPYLVAAGRQRAAAFTIGAELNSMEPRPQWGALADFARTTFPGDVEYDLNYDNFQRGLYPTGPSRYGVDAYIKVLDDSPTPAAVTSTWNAFLDTVNAAAPRGVALSEVGIAARRGAYASPGDSTTPGRFDATVQPIWYAGVCASARQHQLAGIYFWKVDFDADPLAPVTAERATLDFVGRPASEQAIRTCLSAPWPVPAVPVFSAPLASPRPAPPTAAPGPPQPSKSPRASARPTPKPRGTPSPSRTTPRAPSPTATPSPPSPTPTPTPAPAASPSPSTPA